jgi:hypothetical protein
MTQLVDRFPFHAPGIPCPVPHELADTPLVRVWRFADRPDHPDTRHEPDKMQWVDPETRLDCLANRNRGGAWCGYVGVTRMYREYEQGHYTTDGSPDLGDVLRAHGGVNYTDRCPDEEPPEGTGICHIPFEGRSHDIWWIGFDCSHAWDTSPWYEIRHGFTAFPDASYKDVRYLVNEVRELARQIKERNRA